MQFTLYVGSKELDNQTEWKYMFKIYTKKLLNSDWLRKECISSVTRVQTCNTSTKLVTRVQITNGFWLAENTKETTKTWPRTNQIRAVLTTKFKKMAMVFSRRRKTTIEKWKRYSTNPNTVKSTSFWLNVLKMRC